MSSSWMICLRLLFGIFCLNGVFSWYGMKRDASGVCWVFSGVYNRLRSCVFHRSFHDSLSYLLSDCSFKYRIENAFESTGCENDGRGRPPFDFVRAHYFAVIGGSFLELMHLGFPCFTHCTSEWGMILPSPACKWQNSFGITLLLDRGLKFWAGLLYMLPELLFVNVCWKFYVVILAICFTDCFIARSSFNVICGPSV